MLTYSCTGATSLQLLGLLYFEAQPEENVDTTNLPLLFQNYDWRAQTESDYTIKIEVGHIFL